MTVRHTSHPENGISLVPSLDWCDHQHAAHVVQFYGDDDFLLDELAKFIGTALISGDAGLVIATKAHRQGLHERLMYRGFDPERTTSQGRYLALDASETLSQFMVQGMPDRDRFLHVIEGTMGCLKAATQHPRARLVAFGEMVALLWAQGNREGAMRLEQLWNDLARRHDFSLRCGYPIAGFYREEDSQPFLKICAEHSTVIPSESYATLENPDDQLRQISELQQKAQTLETVKAERNQAVAWLESKGLELAEILENALEGVQQLGADERILWANRAMLKMLGYSELEYVNCNFSDFCVRQTSFQKFWARLMRGEEVYDFPIELRRKDGSSRHVLISSNVLWESGCFIHARCFVRDVTEQKKMEEELRHRELLLRVANAELETVVEQRTAVLRHLASNVLTLQDTERRRIARELHDSLGQYLVGLKLHLESLRRFPNSEQMWKSGEELLDKCICEIRTLSHLLHPPMMDESGFASAAQWYVNSFGQRSGINIRLSIPENLDRLPQNMELALFRVLQEALTNVYRHAEAGEVDVILLHDAEQLILEVMDDGKGIDPKRLGRFNQTGTGMGIGLTGIRERIRELGGTLDLISNGKGTSLRVSVPVPASCASLSAEQIRNKA
jgi:PAS domain S-box-containing protein